jgi:hypothetical protein
VFAPSVTIGLYNRGFSVPHQANQFIQSVIQPILIPYWARHPNQSKLKIALFITISGLLLLFSPPLLSWMITTFWQESWLELIPYLPLFCFWAWLILVLGLHETRLKSMGLNRMVLLRAIYLTATTLLSILFLHVDFRSMLTAIVGFHLIYLFIESLFIMRQQFELRIVLPISELCIIVLYFILYG